MSDFTWWPGCGDGSCNTFCNDEGYGLEYYLTTYGGYSSLVYYYDSSVWDSDFYDPDLTGGVGDNDTWNFDTSGAAISFVCGHGWCDDVTTTTCYSDADCGAGAYCPNLPPLGFGESKLCISQKVRNLLTASSTNRHGNVVAYGANFRQLPVKSFALGEDLASGSFGGAATNGGANVSFIVNSCSLRPKYEFLDTSYFFAGVHSVMMPAATAAWRDLAHNYKFSDTGDLSDRGFWIATYVLANPNSPVQLAWLNPTQVNYGFTGDHPWGANVIMAKDATLAMANWHVNTENWFDEKSEAFDATGNGYRSSALLCNYDCIAYPP